MNEEVVLEERTIDEIQADRIKELEQQVNEAADPQELAKAKKAYNDLLKQHIDRRPVPEAKKEVLRPASEIVFELRQVKDGDMTNRKFWAKSLEYRKSYMSETGKDPWTDFSNTGSDQKTKQTEKVATAIEQLLEENTSDVDFRIKLNSIMKDDQNVLAVLAERKKQAKKKGNREN